MIKSGPAGPLLFVEEDAYMSRKDEIVSRTEKLVLPLIEQDGLELVDVEYVKEAGEWYLRIYADKEGGITINDCESLSRAISPLLDKDDFIDDAYILEVSSPGLLRPFKKDRDFERNIGEPVEIRTYKNINGAKEFSGILSSFDKDTVTILTENEVPATYERKDISLIRKYIEF